MVDLPPYPEVTETRPSDRADDGGGVAGAESRLNEKNTKSAPLRGIASQQVSGTHANTGVHGFWGPLAAPFKFAQGRPEVMAFTKR